MPGNFPIVHQHQFNFFTLYKGKEKKEKMFHIYFIPLTILLSFFFFFRIFKCFQKKYSRYFWIFSMAIQLSLKQWRELEWTKGLLKNVFKCQPTLKNQRAILRGSFSIYESRHWRWRVTSVHSHFITPSFTKIQITTRTMVPCA